MKNKLLSLFIIFVIYLIAFTLSYYIVQLFNISNLLLEMFIYDLFATLIVYLGSKIFRNDSVYDPYWSVAPMIMVIMFALKLNFNIDFMMFYIVIIALVVIWGLRLTINFIIRFKNLHYQDWRYTKFKNQLHPFIYQLISFFGFHLLPTLIVFFAMLPVFSYMNQFVSNESLTLNGTFFICIIVSIIAIIIETIADIQMNRFKSDPTNSLKINNKGLWKISRHPNYFGEILFWFSMFLFCISVGDKLWVLIFSPMIVFLLFVVITIPMMEKRELETKEGYAEYKKTTNMLLPIFPKENSKK